jgi:REP element-mobilizing transposase RayT
VRGGDNARGVLDSAATDALRTMFTTICEDFGADLLGCDGEDDYVHLLVEYPPSVAIPKLVNSLTGASSRRLRQQRPDIARALLEWRSVLADQLSRHRAAALRSTYSTVCGAAREHGLTRP